jgi:hypothetical protein
MLTNLVDILRGIAFKRARIDAAESACRRASCTSGRVLDAAGALQSRAEIAPPLAALDARCVSSNSAVPQLHLRTVRVVAAGPLRQYGHSYRCSVSLVLLWDRSHH